MKVKKASHRHLGIAVGKYIAERRKAIGLTQAQLAERIEIESVSLSRIETGAVLPSLVRLQDLAEALGVQVAELVGASSATVADHSGEMEKYLVGLSPQDRLLLVEWVRRFSQRLAKV